MDLTVTISKIDEIQRSANLSDFDGSLSYHLILFPSKWFGWRKKGSMKDLVNFIGSYQRDVPSNLVPNSWQEKHGQ